MGSDVDALKRLVGPGLTQTVDSDASMNPDAHTLWRAPRWALAVLLACLGMLGPFSIDTYLPAFTGIARAIGASPVEMQQTLSAYLFGFAVMNLFHGALSDSAPWNRFMKAKPNRYADSVCCISTGVAPSACAMPENAGM